MLGRAALVRIAVSEELSASFIRVTRIGELGKMIVTASVVPSSPILVTLIMEALSFSETSVLTRATRRNIPEEPFFRIKNDPSNLYVRKQKQWTRAGEVGRNKWPGDVRGKVDSHSFFM
jgi:hypothetical protein